ncbi:IS256 family transposase [Planctomycetota bacterium]
MAKSNGSIKDVDLQALFQEKEGLRDLVEAVVQQVIEREAEAHIGAQAYERSTDRQGYRNGRKSRKVKTRVGELELEIPQVRESASGPYQPSMLARWQRSEKALLIACAEMYFQGVSTRRVQEVLEKMGGIRLSAGQVSRAAVELDESLKTLKCRSLSHTEYPYLMIDARYEKIRVNGHIASNAVLTTVGIDISGVREVLDWRVADSESEDTWSGVLRDLKDRGLQGVRLVISDAQKGIRAALDRYCQGVRWQRCRIHFKRNIMSKVNWKHQKQLMRDLKAVFRPEEKAECLRLAEELAQQWERYPRITQLLREEIEDCLTVCNLPSEHRRKLHSTNMLERVMKDLKQRTAVVTIFPNQASCERLVGARLAELHEKWISDPRRYLNMDHLYREEYQEALALTEAI